MIRFLRDWVDDRTGLGKLIDAMLLEHIPGGAKWRYVWGSALAFVFMIQLVTGVLLMPAYSPSDTQAWNSVYYIQYEMDFGWLIRGLHHFGSQTMVVLMGVHMLQVVIAGAHLKPREVNWWLGLGLLGVILGLSLTGYLLPWDQKGFYATQVATNIAGNMPVVGPFTQKVVVGGTEYGNHTLTRFFALHVAILPGIVIALLVAHIWVFRRHGVTTSKNPVGTGWFWPDQAFRDMIVSMVIFAIMLTLVLYGWGQKVGPKPDADGNIAQRSFYDKVAHGGKDGLGANLDAPADPDSPYPARPEWYFLFLFQLLKYFEGPLFLVGTLVIPGGVGALLFVLPLLGVGKARKLAHIFSVMVVVAILSGAMFLTLQAWVEDQHPDTLAKAPYSWLKQAVAADRYNAERAIAFQHEIEKADHRAKRAIELAGMGIPAEGGRYVLRRDPQTKGLELFKLHCGTCHSCGSECKPETQTASDLSNFGSKEWIMGILTNIDDPRYLGTTHLKGGKMSQFVNGKAKNDAKVKADIEPIADWLATHPRKDAPSDDDKSAFAEGYRKFEKHCSSCHLYGKGTSEEASDLLDLTGYGDAEWLRAMITNPQGDSRYGNRNRMPSYHPLQGPGSELTRARLEREKAAAIKALGEAPEGDKEKKAYEARKDGVELAHRVVHLTDVERELIIRYVMKDDRVVFVGEMITGPPKK